MENNYLKEIGLKIEFNEPDRAKIVKLDKNKPWPNNDLSNKTLLKYLNRTENIKKIQFTDENGVGDGIKIYFHENNLNKVKNIISRITMSCFGCDFILKVEYDLKYGKRIFLQVKYKAPCTKSGNIEEWGGRKWYLSDYMTDDEVIKTAYCAFEAAVKHEIMEGFKVDNIILFNPHINYEELLKVSHNEIKRS